MCGILGIVTCRGGSPRVDDAAVVRMRDTMARRGPDGAGLWRNENVVLAHRRLEVVAPGPEGAQPFVTAAGSALVYNGELYNDRELRESLRVEGAEFRTRSDTETLALHLERRGLQDFHRIRGMYAFGFVDARRQVLVLARDPLGIKPLFWAEIDGEIVFASDVRAILAHPRMTARPDMVTLSAYLTTIRLTLNERTLFAGIRTVRPGEWIEISLTDGGARWATDWWDAAHTFHLPTGESEESRQARVRECVRDSVKRHLRSDVPLCCLLSGGLDSTILTTLAQREQREEQLWTYCAGAAQPPEAKDDFFHARAVAARLGSHHVEAPVTRDTFCDRWRWMVNESAMPLSTPNEVAINEVARRLRADGKVVALSGEGADELFGGYEGVMEDASRRFASLAGCEPGDWRIRGGEIMLASSTWIPAAEKAGILNEEALTATENDLHLTEFCREEFARLASGGGAQEPMQAALRYQRRVNLEGLLRRLDSATMLEGVEGRTPFADQDVAQLAESLPTQDKYSPNTTGSKGKLVLRRAFGADLPPEILNRPKASFPLPFQEWGQAAAEALETSAFAKEMFTGPARALLRAQSWESQGLWRVGWPLVNLAMWGKRWWG